MMVTFISQCEKKALPKTRRVLDAFANRIGDNSWQTIITQEGLLAVKKLLRKSASKNTAVACHWMRSRQRSELVWVVGNKLKFNATGFVPVNSTSNHHALRDDLADWHYLPLIQALASLSALLHDWGKASARFQQKLAKSYKGMQGDALRHEWVSCLLLRALINTTNSQTDEGWLSLLASGDISEPAILDTDLKSLTQPLSDLPPIASMIAWLVLTHHKLPFIVKKSERAESMLGRKSDSMRELFTYVSENWGYANEKAKQTLRDCLIFPEGLMTNSRVWQKEVKRWSKKLLAQQSILETVFAQQHYRPLLHHARLCLMLGDHYFSSLTLEKSGKWHGKTNLIANTQKNGSPKQALDQHLVGVYEQAKRNARNLPKFESDLPITDNTAALKKLSPKHFVWQDKAARKVRDWTTQQNGEKTGFFAVNMASTGCGKTIANAKVLLGLSENYDTLRYILALGLRTLTLQTGDEYRQRIFQQTDTSDLGVIIGSKAILDLHNISQDADEDAPLVSNGRGSDSAESLLGLNEEVDYDFEIPEEGLATLLPNNKARKFLYAPILVCTIDHIITATETTRGGRYILPSLRLMSSDLVIDEIDDFTDSDAIAIGRLIHMAGMLGRKVMISSATITPSVAEGYFNCYREGWCLFAATRNAKQKIGCAWIDEFDTQIKDLDVLEKDISSQAYAQAHQRFVKKRVKKLSSQPARRKAEIIDCNQLLLESDETSKQAGYFRIMAEAAIKKHLLHANTDEKTNLQVSFGVIRMANINPCVQMARYLLDYLPPKEYAIRTMAYHSKQALLLRHEQELHLDAVLKRKEKKGEAPYAFGNPIIRKHLDQIAEKEEDAQHVLFILVATPVEEVGRDHDFDWALIEPSSFRSIVQLAGRVKRHRTGETHAPNVGILRYNWRTIKEGDQSQACRFFRPGYESNEDIIVNHRPRKAVCHTHDLKQLINPGMVLKGLNAIARIDADFAKENKFGIALLEHAVITHWLNQTQEVGPETLQGYLTQHWYLTGLPQVFNRFRESEETLPLYRYPSDQHEPCFFQRNQDGFILCADQSDEPSNVATKQNIAPLCLTPEQEERLWLVRDYEQTLSDLAEKKDATLVDMALRFGELTIRQTDHELTSKQYLYNDQLGLFDKERR